jgi:hypothetical protein
MADNNALREIRELVLADPALQERLRVTIDKADFTNAVVSLAEEQGLVLTEDDVVEAMRTGRKMWIERWI